MNVIFCREAGTIVLDYGTQLVFAHQTEDVRVVQRPTYRELQIEFWGTMSYDFLRDQMDRCELDYLSHSGKTITLKLSDTDTLDIRE